MTRCYRLMLYPLLGSLLACGDSAGASTTGSTVAGDPPTQADPSPATGEEPPHHEIAHWVIMGHSLGGTAAARYAHDTQHSLSALVILSSFNDKAHTLASSTLPTLTVVGTKEKIVLDSHRNNELHQAQAFLPPSAKIAEIEGGTHFGFTYSEPPAPEAGTISVAEQHAQYAEIVHAFIQANLPAQ